ncbi:glycosyltransferase [Dokdonia sp. Dokd-P16]|nr:glycosyltransferase [Dokdonia sp. Dokd-P16]
MRIDYIWYSKFLPLPKDTHKKIALVTISLAGGGAERSLGILSTMLSGLGHTVHIVTLREDIEVPYTGTLFNLGSYKFTDDSLTARWGHLKRLRAYLIQHNFDLIIDNRSRPSLLKEICYTQYIYRNLKVAFMVRSARLETYFPKPISIAKRLYNNSNFIGVSKRICDKITETYGFRNTNHIYNAIPQFSVAETSSTLPSTYILGYGRLVDDVKNFSLMISAFAKANLKTPLVIMGDGQDNEKLVILAKKLNVSNKIYFVGHQRQPSSIVKNALFTLLTSHYEGFPMVLVESLSLGTPVISVDCESGPNEIVQHGHNGLLVPNYDIVALSNAIRMFVLDGELLAHCKSNAKDSVAHLSQEQISNDWNTLINSL